ncbi:MAG: fimbrillin family protein, partial [Bacteroidales bacterium]|nr:fimbrillin family protein [Bacteroidales bacterium]
RNKSGKSNAEWCYITGTVNLKAATTTAGNVGTVVLQPIEGGATAQVTETALIYPGSNFGDTDADVVAQVNAGSNIYYVTAKEIRAAIRAAIGGDDFSAKPGHHYVFTVTINKTDVNVTATITDWQTLNAAEATPAIVVTAEVGNEDNTTLTLPEFRFYYNDAATPGTGTYPKNVTFTAKADALNPEAGDKADGATHWHFYPVGNTDGDAISLYWPDHTLHYFFRGVYPTATAVEQDGGKTYIAVQNVAYDANSFPSNLMIGAPEINPGTNCNNPDHAAVDMSQNGICARTGAINLNFRYMMSRVEVELTTTTGDDKVNINAGTKVELLNVYRKGKVYLGERNAVASDKGEYTLNNVTGSDLLRHSAIVPQTIADGLQFKITVTNANSTTDVYYASVKDIKVEGNNITDWKSGKHYKYTLRLKKTGIAVTATITDWTTANGDDIIWL